MTGPRSGRKGRDGDSESPPLYAEVVEGLADLAAEELLALGANLLSAGPDGLRFTHPTPQRLCRRSRLVSAVYRELRFAVPRPKALLGDEALRRLAAAMSAAARDGGLHGFRVAAAGSDSPVFRRLARDLSAATGLEHDPVAGEMLLRVRRYGRSVGPGQAEPDAGWEVLVRLTGRPLSTRSWRVCNRPGGVNSTVAVAMNRLVLSPSGPNRPVGTEPGVAYLNLMCGSGTLLVERALGGPVRRLVGVDSEPAALACARENLTAAGVKSCELLPADVASLVGASEGGGTASLAAAGGGALARGAFQELTADPPWGDAVGEHAGNEALHLALLAAAAWLAAPGAGFALLSHEVRLLQRLLPRQEAWRVESSLRLSHGGHRPQLLLLRRV